MKRSLAFMGAITVGSLLFTSRAALADEPPPEEKTAAASSPKEEVDEDGVRFRGGISGGAGALIFGSKVAGLGGIDGRLGVQIMDLIGVYVEPQIALGADGTFFAGSVGGSLLVDFTFIDQIFVGVGGGAGLVQYGGTEGAGELHFRAGGYPVFGYGEDGVRRKGLMIGADVRLHFVSGEVLVSPMVSVGYEAF